MQDTKVRFDLPGNELMPELLGQSDELLQIIETSFPETKIHVRGNQIAIDGDSAILIEQIFREMTRMLERGLPLDVNVLKKTIEKNYFKIKTVDLKFDIPALRRDMESKTDKILNKTFKK